MFYIWIALLCSLGLACVQGGQVFRTVQHKQVSESEVQVSWVISPAQALSWNYKISHTYHLSQIGDCQPVLRSTQISRQIESSQTFLRLTGLRAWRTYQYKLKAPVTFFKQEEVATGTFSTRPARSPSSTVRNVHVENVTQSSVDLSWQEPPCVERNGPLRRFDVLLMGPDSQNVLNAFTGVYVTVGNLEAGTTYVVRVRYVNTIGPSPFTADVSFTTSPSVHGNSSVNGSVNVGSTSIPATVPGGSGVNGSVNVTTATGLGASGVNGSVNMTSTTATTPLPTVSTTAMPDPPRPSRSACGSVDKPCAPYNIKVIKRELTCVVVTWQIVDILGKVAAFDVFDCTADSDINMLTSPITSPPRSSSLAKICDLQPGAFYTFAMRSRTVDQIVSPLVTFKVHTDHAEPPKPGPPQLLSVAMNTIHVTLIGVSSEKGPVTSYYVIVQPILLDEEARVSAGIASSPKAYFNGEPVLSGGPKQAFEPAANMAQKENEDDDAGGLDRGAEDDTQYHDPASQGRNRPRLPSPAAQKANTIHPEAEDAQFVDGLVDSLSRTPLENRSKNSPRVGGTNAEKKVAQAQSRAGQVPPQRDRQGVNQRGRQLSEVPIQQWRSNPAADAGTHTGPPFLIVRRVVPPKASNGRGKLSKAADTSEQQTDVSSKSFGPQLNFESQKQSQFNSGLLGNAKHTSDSAYQQQVSSNSAFKSHQNTLSGSKASLGAPALKGRPSSRVGIVGRVNTKGGGESKPGRGQISIKPKVTLVKNSSPSRNGASAIQKPAVAAKKAKVSVHKNGESRITFKAQVEQTGPEQTEVSWNNPVTGKTNKTAATVSLKSSQTRDPLDSEKEKESDAAQIQRDRDTENTDSSIGSTPNTAQPKTKMQFSDDADDSFEANKETNSERKQPEIPSVSKQPQSLEATVSASFEDKRSGSSAIDTNAKTGLRQNTKESVSDGKVRITETVEQYNPPAGNAHARNNTAQEQELPRLNAGKSETKQEVNPEQDNSVNKPLAKLKNTPKDKSMTERRNVSNSFLESKTPSSGTPANAEETLGNKKPASFQEKVPDRSRKTSPETMNAMANTIGKSIGEAPNLIHRKSRSTTENDANRNRKSTFNTEHSPHRSRKSTSHTGNRPFRKKRTLKTARTLKSNTENRPLRGKRTINTARRAIMAHIKNRDSRNKRTINTAKTLKSNTENSPSRNKRTINTARRAITAHIKNSPFRNKRTIQAASGAMVARKPSNVYILPPGQIVAELTPDELRKRGLNFVIGDGGTYNGFINSPLSPEGRYNVYLVANSEVEDIKFSVSTPLAVSMSLEPSESRTIAGRRRDNYIVMGVMLSAGFIILLVMSWIKCQQHQTKGEAGCVCCRFDIPNHFWMTTFEFGEPMNRLGTPLLSARDQQYVTEERHWSDTYSLSEPRVITTGRELLLPSQVGMLPPSQQKPANAQPITFRKEFLSLPRVNPANPSQAGTMHKERNNTPTILPYDATRVVLDHDGTGGGDYYNASYLTGYMDDNGRRGTYIGAQCPFDEGTALDMWRLIYQHSVPTVVVLSKVIEDGVLKCFKFWPEVGRCEYGPFVLQAVDHFSYAHYTEHLVSVKKRKRKNEELVVRIFCFSSWPEKGVPQDSTPFVELCTRVHKSHGANTAPILVQCDTGSGRTAVFIASDILLAQYATENQASVYDVVCALRSERPHMVQNFPQYAFIYQALLEEMHAGDTWVSEDLRERYRELSRHNANTGRTYLRDQFMMLELMLSKPDVKADPAKGDGPLSNDVPDLIPGKRLEFNIPTAHNRNASSNAEPPDIYGGDDDDNDSLEGLEPVAMVDGYRRKKQFLMTNTPLPSGVSDFWQYVYENDVRSIVVMEEPDPTMAAGRSRGEYWPMSGSRMWDPFLVELLDNSNSEEGITVRTFRVVHMHRTRDEPRTVRQFQFHGWTASPEPGVGRQARRGVLSRPPSHYSMMYDDGLTNTRGTNRRGGQCCPPPNTRAVLLCLNNMVRQWQDHVSVDSTPILVHCRDGVLCSGLFVALSLIAARMDEENLVSVYRACRSIRKVSPHAIGNFDQYKFLYKILWDYINLPPDGSPQDHFVPPLDSPEFDRRPIQGRYVDKEKLPDYPEDSEDYVPGGLYGATTTDGNFTAEPQEHDYYDTFATMEVTETEEETIGDCVTRNGSYYTACSRPTPTSRHRAHALSSLSSTNDESFRFTPHNFNPAADRPPRQGARYSGYPSPVSAPSPSSAQKRRADMSPAGRRELPPTPNRTPPRTPSRNQPSSFLSRTPSPAPRRRPQSLSPVTQSRLHSPPQRKRRESAAGRMVGVDAPRTSPARERGSAGSRRGSARASPARNRGSARASPAARDRGSARSSPVRPGRGNSPIQVKSESVVQETTEMMDEQGVFYRQEVTDYIQELSAHDTTTTSDTSDF